MRDPCPYCGLPKVAASRIDLWTNELVRDIKEHACYGWESKPVLENVPSDTSFIAEYRNSAEGLAAYREYQRRQK